MSSEGHAKHLQRALRINFSPEKWDKDHAVSVKCAHGEEPRAVLKNRRRPVAGNRPREPGKVENPKKSILSDFILERN